MIRFTRVYLFVEVCSRNFQFGTRWKYQSRLFGCRKHVVYTIGRWNDKQHEVRQMLLRGKISWEISQLWIKFIKFWIRNLSTAVFLFDISHKFFHSINYVTHLTEAYSEPCTHLTHLTHSRDTSDWGVFLDVWQGSEYASVWD